MQLFPSQLLVVMICSYFVYIEGLPLVAMESLYFFMFELTTIDRAIALLLPVCSSEKWRHVLAKSLASSRSFRTLKIDKCSSLDRLRKEAIFASGFSYLVVVVILP